LAAGACLPVNGDRLRAGDLAAADPIFAALPAETVVGYSPAPGVRRWFRGAELARLARRHGLSPASSRDVCFEREMAPLDPARLAEAMKRSLAPGARVEIAEYSRHPAPRGEIEFPRPGLSPKAASSGLALWRGFVRYGAGRRFTIWARVKVAVPARRVVAARALAPSKPIAAADLRIDSIEAFPSAGGFAESLEDAVGRLPRRTIGAGEPVPLAALDSPRDVAAGDTLRIEANTGAARVELVARAESPGRRGDVILVRNTTNQRRFRARIEGPGRATPAGLAERSLGENGK
jgi:flagella basal body P-ring formation protein FlgA